MRVASGARIDREAFIEWFTRNRERSRQLFDMLEPDAYYSRPIALRHPIVFYEGHLPAFTVNTLLKKALRSPGIDADLERLFARGIDPGDESTARHHARDVWPSRDIVHAYAERADAAVLDVLQHADLDSPGHPYLDRGEAVHAVLEHEAMHQETLLYMWHQLPYEQKRAPEGTRVVVEGPAHAPREIRIDAGVATLGADRGAIPFAWDNELPVLRVPVPAFRIDAFDVTNAEYREFVEAGGYRERSLWDADAWAWLQRDGRTAPPFWSREGGEWRWRAMFAAVPLPPTWPVYVTQAEATAYARWRGRRLPSEAEYHRAAFGGPDGTERELAWGTATVDATRGNFDFVHWDPVPVGSSPEGASAWGVHDLVGNGWEWTATVFAPFPGFEPIPSYPEYSADFFDGEHYVMKGASPVTARELVRRSFRNWFRPTYPYVYATFRTAVSDVRS